jgi:hypothetical protein
LSGEAPTPIIRLCVERVVTCWLQIQYLDVLDSGFTDGSTPHAKAVGKQQDQAHRRYLQALKSLEILRRLSAIRRSQEMQRPDMHLYAAEEGQKVRVTATG